MIAASVATRIGGVVSLGPGALYLDNPLYKVCESGSFFYQEGCSWTGVQSLKYRHMRRQLSGCNTMWLGTFRERVCWWEVVLLVISAFADGKSFCLSDGPLLAKRPFAGGTALCRWHGPLLAARPFAGGTALCWRHGPLLAARPFAGGTRFAGGAPFAGGMALCWWNAICWGNHKTRLMIRND